MAALVLALGPGACGDDIPSVSVSDSGGLLPGEVAMTTTGGTTTGPEEPGQPDETSSGPPVRSDSSGAPEPLPTEDELPLALAEGLCLRAAACDCPNYDAAKCVIEASATLVQWQAYATDNELVFDEGCWAELHAQLQDESCARPEVDCAVYRGALREDEVCSFPAPFQQPCAEPLVCSGGACVSSVTRPEPPGEGESCFDRRTGFFIGCDVDQGLACDFPRGVCVAFPQVGLPCEEGDCAPGAWCDALDDDGPVCKPQQPAGAPCVAAEQCETFLCGEGRCLGVGEVCYFLGQLLG